MPHFECGAFNHSATSPEAGEKREASYREAFPRASQLLGAPAPSRPIDRKNPHPQEQCHNVEQSGQLVQRLLPRPVRSPEQHHHAGKHSEGEAKPHKYPNDAHGPSGHDQCPMAKNSQSGIAFSRPTVKLTGQRNKRAGARGTPIADASTSIGMKRCPRPRRGG